MALRKEAPSRKGERTEASLTGAASLPPQPTEASEWISEVRACGAVLERTQWLNPNQLRRYQAPLVANLLRHARATTEFYAERFDHSFEAPENFERAWRDIPILTRKEAAKRREELISQSHPAEAGSVMEGQTSGSTGTPLSFGKSASSAIVDTALTERFFDWWSMDGAASLAYIAYEGADQPASREGQSSVGWHSKDPSGARHFMGIHVDTKTMLDWLMARRPAYLGAYPPVLRELAILARETGADLSFEQLVSFSAVLDDETRRLCRSVFGAAVADGYGAQEIGHIAAQCPDCGEYHVSAEGCVVEVLRPDGSAAAPGECGHVVVTPLFNFAMPFIRFELGDVAEVGCAEPSCGRGLPTLRRILGRVRNMFRFSDGSVIWPIASAFRLGEYVNHTQYQIVQTDLQHIEIRYVWEGEPQKIDVAGLTQQVCSALKQRVSVAVCRVSEIPRTRTGKYEDCVSLTTEGAADAPVRGFE